MVSIELPENCKVLAQELVLNGPIHMSQIPEQPHPKTELGRPALEHLITLGFANRIVVKGSGEFAAATHTNPFFSS